MRVRVFDVACLGGWLLLGRNGRIHLVCPLGGVSVNGAVTFGSGQLCVLSWDWVLVSIFGVSEECDCGFVFGVG